MALSSTLTLSAASCTTGQAIRAKVTVSNSVATAVTIQSIVPSAIFTGNTAPVDKSSVSFGDIPLSQGFNNIIPASSSADFFFDVVPYAPTTKNDDSGSGTYSVSCVVNANDSSSHSPTAATLTVHPVLPLF